MGVGGGTEVAIAVGGNRDALPLAVVVGLDLVQGDGIGLAHLLC